MSARLPPVDLKPYALHHTPCSSPILLTRAPHRLSQCQSLTLGCKIAFRTTEEMKSFPAKTRADTNCVRLFDTRREHRMETTTADILTVADMTKHQMQYWKERFVLEVSKCGEVYPPNSLHHIVVGIRRHV